jgi:hypothetical protein
MSSRNCSIELVTVWMAGFQFRSFKTSSDTHPVHYAMVTRCSIPWVDLVKVEPYLNFSIHLHGMVINSLSRVSTLTFDICWGEITWTFVEVDTLYMWNGNVKSFKDFGSCCFWSFCICLLIYLYINIYFNTIKFGVGSTTGHHLVCCRQL